MIVPILFLSLIKVNKMIVCVLFLSLVKVNGKDFCCEKTLLFFSQNQLALLESRSLAGFLVRLRWKNVHFLSLVNLNSENLAIERLFIF